MVVERTYTIPLRREWLKTPRWRRAKKAKTAVQEFLRKHMKSEDVRIGKYLNEEIWKNGIKSPPAKVKVNVVKDDKGVVKAELVGAPVEKKVEPKKAVKKKAAKKTVKKEEPKAEEKAEVKKEEPKAKKEEKPAAKEEKKEAPKEDVKITEKQKKTADQIRKESEEKIAEELKKLEDKK